jgi:hypothetical protein
MGNDIMVGGWQYAAASTIGTSHQTSAEGVCQDAHALQFVEGLDVFVGVVSDGAGSASQSQIASHHTCDAVLKRIAEAAPETVFSESLATGTLEQLRAELQQLADEGGFGLREFACTLLVAIVGEERAAFWQIGDGAICFREREEDRFGYAFWPEKGDYANVTFFVTDQNAQSHLEFDVADIDIAEIAIFSDGLERLALDFVSGEAYTAFFRGLFPAFRGVPNPGYSAELSSQITDFLASERVNRRTDDDKTLLLACRAI